MQKRLHFGFLIVVLILIGVLPVSSQEADSGLQDEEPDWLLLEMGKLEIKRGEFGKALYLFNRVLDLRPHCPEAEMALGDIFMAESELKLAEEQYRKAYEEKDSFLVPEDTYTLLYRIADVHRIAGQYREWEDALLEVLQEDETYYNETYVRYRELYVAKYLEEGLNRLLELYRLERQPATRAHQELGDLYYWSGVYDSTALAHRLFGVLIVLSDAIAEYRMIDPLYQFKDLGSFLALASRRENIDSYLRSTEFYRHLYYLGVSTYASGALERAREVWNVLKDIEEAGMYRQLAARQLSAPWVDEPTMVF